MGKNSKSWNNRGDWINTRERRKRDPLYKFPFDMFYTTEITTWDAIDSDPPKADKYGIYHLANA